MTENFICLQCGTQFAETSEPPEHCAICEDERQYVNPDGQQWTTLEQLRADRHARIEAEAENLPGIGIEPEFAIGQRALLLQSPGGNLLWDCVSLINDEIVQRVRALGGIRAIAISHPHYYSSMIEWSDAFGGVPIYLHAADREWVMRNDRRIEFWDATTLQLWDDLTLINCGGHFEGGTVVHWPAGANGKGVLLTGDIIQTIADPRWVSFMRSYPNLIPLGAAAIHRIIERVEPFHFDQLFAAWWKRNVLADAKEVVRRSAQRYLRAIAD
jgi:glyoxylase-like metal-dependent hydrolase (beta-lactamase superfamily II)